MSYWLLRIIESSFKVTSINDPNWKMKLGLMELQSLRHLVFWAIWLVWYFWIEHYNNMWSKQNKLASVNACFKIAIKSILNGFLLPMLRLSILEFTSCSWTKLRWMVRIISCAHLAAQIEPSGQFISKPGQFVSTYNLGQNCWENSGFGLTAITTFRNAPTPLINVARQNKACETWAYQHWW